MAEDTPWRTVRVLKEAPIYWCYPGTTELRDEGTNLKHGTIIVLGEPRKVLIAGTHRAVCRILERSCVTYVLVGELGDKILLTDALSFIKYEKV